MSAVVQSFFYKAFESGLNERLLERGYALSTESVMQYLRELVRIPLSKYVDFVVNDMARCGITTADIPQFSSWEDGAENICKEIKRAGDAGYKHTEIGRLLFKDGKHRNDVAYRKYGEGHAKLAKKLGLLQEIDKTYFLSCIGCVWGLVPFALKDRLYVRFLLRFGLVQYLLHETQNDVVDLREVVMGLGLSGWGCYRRHSNVKCVLDRLCATDEYDFSAFRSKVDVDGMLDRGERI